MNELFENKTRLFIFFNTENWLLRIRKSHLWKQNVGEEGKIKSWLCVWLCMSGSVCSLHLSFFFVFFFLDAPLKQYSGGSGWPSCTPPHLCPPLSLQQHAPRRCVSACLCRPGRRCKSHHDSVSNPSLSIRGVSYTKSAPLLIGIFFKKKTTTFQRQWL